MSGIESYPLTWPAGWKRTPASARRGGRFEVRTTEYRETGRVTRRGSLTTKVALERVYAELARMGIRDWNVIVSTNVQLKRDGQPYSGIEPDDPGAAVYWRGVGNDERRCMAIDLYDRVADNLGAIAATLDAMRAIERHGGATVLDRAFMGFVALPAPGRSWRDVLDVPDHGTVAEQLARARMHYRACAGVNHPDRGGNADAMAEYNRAWESAQKELAP